MTGLNFETCEDRVGRQKANILLLGASGSGKTSAAATLNPENTLFIDGEAGTMALGDWKGVTLDVLKESSRMNTHPWLFARALACVLAGPDPTAQANTAYSKEKYDIFNKAFGESVFDKFDTIFVDSVTVISRWCFEWAQTQPEAFSEKTGKPDIRGAFGLLGREMVKWATRLQHQDKNIILSCILDEATDDFSRTIYTPQLVGQKSGRELPGIFDVVLTIHVGEQNDPQRRVIHTDRGNKYGYPSKDRSKKLNPVEDVDLSVILKKITGV